MTAYYRLIAVTDPSLHPNISLPDACRAAVQGGVTSVQIRMKHEGADKLLRATEAVSRAVDVPVFVNDRADVALAAGCMGVHFGADDFPPSASSKLSLGKLGIGVSVGNESEANQALDYSADYWSLGPCFESKSKNDAGTPLSHGQIRDLIRLVPQGTGIVGIGGINEGNIEGLKALGFQGVAVISAVFGARDIQKAARRLRDVIDTW